MSSYAAAAILRTGMKSLLKTAHWKIRDSVMESYKNVKCN